MEINLNKGQEYDIELYPTDETVTAKYLGEEEGDHFFESKNSYIIVNNNWITINRGVITHKSISSASIPIIPKNKLDKVEDGKIKSGLLKILNETRK